MPSITLTSLATNAADYLGVLDSGEGLSAQQITDALFDANNLLDNWSSEQAMVPSLGQLELPTVLGKNIYTFGGSPGWGVNRPVAIASAYFRMANGPTSPVAVLSAPKWDAIPDRESQSYLIKAIYFDRQRGASWATGGNVFTYPKPLGAGTLGMAVWQPLDQFPDAATATLIPPGYLRILAMALAVEMAPRFEVTPSAVLMGNYADAIARVRNLNAQLLGNEPPSGQVTADSGAAQIAANQAGQ